MDPQRRDSWREVIPGVAILLTMIPLAVGIFLLDAVRRGVTEGPALVVLAQEGGGLVPGADVWVAGKPGGRVRSISFVDRGDNQPGELALNIVLLREAAPALRADASVTIGSSALLAPPVVKFEPGSPSLPPIAFGDTLRATSGPDMDTFRAFADSGRAALEEMTGELERLALELERGDGSIPRSLRDPELTRLLASIRSRASVLERSWAARRDLGPVLVDSLSISSLESLSESTSALKEAAALRSESLDGVGSALARLGGRIDRMNLAMRSGQGTAGRLLHDGELEAQASRARAQLDSLQAELAANPLVWLRFRLF
jgi:hypothetical protein